MYYIHLYIYIYTHIIYISIINNCHYHNYKGLYAKSSFFGNLVMVPFTFSPKKDLAPRNWGNPSTPNWRAYLPRADPTCAARTFRGEFVAGKKPPKIIFIIVHIS